MTIKNQTLLMIVGLLAVCILPACNRSSDDSQGSENIASTFSTSIASQSETISPTPIPTYAPGTDLYGMLSVTGDVLIEPQYEYLDLFSVDGLARFEDHGLWGFVDKTGKEVIKAQYEDARVFSEELAAVKVDGLYGFIDMTGKMVIQPQFEDIIEGFKYERCVFGDNSNYGLMDMSGNVIFEPKYSGIAFCCSEYIVVTNTNGEYGVYDRDGNLVMDYQEMEVIDVDPEGYIFFSEKAITFQKLTDLDGSVKYSVDSENSFFYENYTDGCPYISRSENGELWGVYSLQTHEYTTEIIYDHIWIYIESYDYSIVFIDDLFGLVSSSSGDSILPCQYGYFLFGGDYFEYYNDEFAYDKGIVSHEGDIILDPIYYYVISSTIGQFSAWTEKQTSYVVDMQGDYIFETQPFEIIFNFLPDLNCWLYYDGDNGDNIGIINLQGEVVLKNEYQFDWLKNMSPYYIDSQNYYYFIDSQLELVKTGPYREIFDFSDQSGVIVVVDNANEYSIINARGDTLYASDRAIEFVDGDAEFFIITKKAE
jgi:hypothetical protein